MGDGALVGEKGTLLDFGMCSLSTRVAGTDWDLVLSMTL